jgi:hypothetical protein
MKQLHYSFLAAKAQLALSEIPGARRLGAVNTVMVTITLAIRSPNLISKSHPPKYLPFPPSCHSALWSLFSGPPVSATRLPAP